MTPPSDHFEGTHFRNPGNAQVAGLGAVLRWSLTRRRTPWPRWVQDPNFPPPQPAVTPGHVGLTFIGHSTLLVRLPLPDGGVFSFLTDPVFSDRCSPSQLAGPHRVRAPGLALDALPRVDAVLVSHNHYDHMDLDSLQALHRRFGAPVITTLGNAAPLGRAGVPGATELDWWQATQAGPAVITATPACHFSARGVLDRNRTLWAGFMVRIGARQVFFAGDSGAGPHWRAIRKRLGPPGVALLPIGAYAPRHIMRPVHMNPTEAVQARADLGAARAVGMHFGTFQLTDEGIGDPVRDLAAARATAGLLTDAFDVLGCGETRELPLPAGR